MTKHDFTLVLEGADIMNDATLDALYEAGCDDATFGLISGALYADFAREAPTLSDAVLKAVEQVESAVPGLRVIRVEPDELVTAAEIAKRVGRSRANVHQLAGGQRGPGDFPAPAMVLANRQPLWRWSDVAVWFERYGSVRSEVVQDSHFLAALNGALETRRQLSYLSSQKDSDALLDLLQQTA